MSRIFRLIILLLVITVTACVSSQSNMSAANDEDQDIGIGGTGMLANTGSGMGGTGMLANTDNGLGGTGIVGEVTGFGSVFVNGIEIEYGSETTFTIDGKTAVHQQLVIGDVVEVLTTDAKQHTSAQVINLRHEVIGPVESVNAQEASFTVLGQTIKIADKEMLPETGSRVAVSGMRVDERTIQASRVRQTDTKQTLLRKHTKLPFKEKVSRWIIQTHVQNSKATLHLDGVQHNLSLKGKTGTALNGRSVSRILQLQKSESDQLKVNRVIDPVKMPRGRSISIPVQQSGNMMQRPVQMNRQPRMYRGGR